MRNRPLWSSRRNPIVLTGYCCCGSPPRYWRRQRPGLSGCSPRRSPQVYAIPGPQLGDIVAAGVRDPDLRAIKCDAIGTAAGRESSQQSAVACSQFSHVIAAEICYPDIRPIESHVVGGTADGERTQHGAIAAAKLGDAVATDIADPNVCAAKSYARRVGAYGEGPQHGAIVGPELGHVAGEAVGRPDVGPVEDPVLQAPHPADVCVQQEVGEPESGARASFRLLQLPPGPQQHQGNPGCGSGAYGRQMDAG